ncbi:MAG: RNA-binding S4 domain-containing protein [Bacillota bacterium]
MRLDKYLKVSRLVKRRTVAKEMCEAGRVTVNDRPAKPGTEIKPGDRLVIGFGTKQIRIEVVECRDSCPSGECESMYRHIEA